MAGIEKQTSMSLYLDLYFNEHKIGTGTGFIMNSNSGHPLLITNWHNLSGKNPDTGQPLDTLTGAVPNRVVIWHAAGDKVFHNSGEWIAKSEPLYREEDYLQPLWFEHPVLGPKVDIAALPLTDYENTSLTAYPFVPFWWSPEVVNGQLGVREFQLHGIPLKMRVTKALYIIGFPFGLGYGPQAGKFAIWSTGFIASEPEIDYDELPLFLIDSRTRKGQSGSPVIFHFMGGMLETNDGNTNLVNQQLSLLMGIYSGRIDDGTGVSSDLGRVWKTSAIKELIDSIQSDYDLIKQDFNTAQNDNVEVDARLLNDAQIERISHYMEAKQPKCGSCGNNSFDINDQLVNAVPFFSNQNRNPVPFLLCICRNCAVIMPVAAVPLGLVS